ncbi:apolipoprotein N-acyltransferase [Lutibaculum baratangense]|uniref:Apolipoprotein N-acyltransferase n=1 Tax=Lutibaculum baratangense AMV1 TaxID=631454 RepID=V4RRX6_9HYPH|nr:apolipoprotein N-acyltransferase [Lutibaculum baratangense]ESR25875.1 Apolipoprotein N-acyltransferase [Lutibaculum baratangense AMV1]
MSDFVDSLAGRLALLWGWRRLLVAFLLGAASALAMAPYDVFPILFITFPALVWLMDGTVAAGRARRLKSLLPAALTGWAFGFGYFLAGLWWIGSAFLVEAETFAWMIPFAMLLLPAGLALFTGLGAAVARLLWSRGPARVFAFAFGMAGAEFVRGTVLTGFPWNGFGYALAATEASMQAASAVGTYGLAVLACVLFAAPAALSGSGEGFARALPSALAVILIPGIFGFGHWHLREGEVGPDPAVRLRIVQPSIPQGQKWLAENRSAILAEYLELSDRSASPDAMGAGDADLVIWPESAIPFVFDFETVALPAIAAMLPAGTSLVSGLQRVEPDDTRPYGYRVYNSIFVIDDRGEVEDVYDKVKLVPFGEFLPWQSTLESVGLRQLTQVIGGFEAGEVRDLLTSGSAPPFLPLICYEIIFPGRLVGPDLPRPAWILNVTNDAWFGDSPGPWQHLRQARVRAVEEGLPVVRAANTGISAVIDAKGRVVRRLGLGEKGVIDAGLPAAAPPTLYARYREMPFLGLMAFCLLVAAAGAVARRR